MLVFDFARSRTTTEDISCNDIKAGTARIACDYFEIDGRQTRPVQRLYDHDHIPTIMIAPAGVVEIECCGLPTPHQTSADARVSAIFISDTNKI